MRIYIPLVLMLIFTSCLVDDSVAIEFDSTPTLQQELEGQIYQTDAFLAFASNSQESSNVLDVYVLLENGAADISFYESNASSIDSQDLSNYKLLNIEPSSIFNGSLALFKRPLGIEEWIIITYKIDDKVKLSSPTRTRNRFRRTQYLDDININQEESSQPLFDWVIDDEENNAFFFEIMANANDDALSKTFTNENKFRYFDLQNVILNLTNGMAPALQLNSHYEFIVFDVDFNNWINSIYIKEFTAE